MSWGLIIVGVACFGLASGFGRAWVWRTDTVNGKVVMASSCISWQSPYRDRWPVLALGSMAILALAAWSPWSGRDSPTTRAAMRNAGRAVAVLALVGTVVVWSSSGGALGPREPDLAASCGASV